MHGLSTEEKALLSKSRPSTLGAAKRIQGVTPVAILELMRHTKKVRSLAEIGSREQLKRREMIGMEM
jgi:tRNA U34 5-carboxymethylaminomethyl modifying enzyme MnmG/GidA